MEAIAKIAFLEVGDILSTFLSSKRTSFKEMYKEGQQSFNDLLKPNIVTDPFAMMYQIYDKFDFFGLKHLVTIEAEDETAVNPFGVMGKAKKSGLIWKLS